MRLKLTTIITVLTLFFCHSTFGQGSISSTPSELYGIWYRAYKYNGYNDTIPFLRTKNSPRDYGQRIEINPNNEYIDAYVAPCGNDGDIHHSVGKWTYDSKTQIFEATVPICIKDKKYRIATLTNDTLVLVKP